MALWPDPFIRLHPVFNCSHVFSNGFRLYSNFHFRFRNSSLEIFEKCQLLPLWEWGNLRALNVFFESYFTVLSWNKILYILPLLILLFLCDISLKTFFKQKHYSIYITYLLYRLMNWVGIMFKDHTLNIFTK